MARYYTNTEELTSIANAIRAKSDTNTPLVFPNGFISAIENLSTDGPPYDYKGENIELLDTVYETTITLGDTRFSPSSVTTSNTTIYDYTELAQIYLPSNLDYIIKTIISVDYQYAEGTDYKPRMIEGYYASINFIGRKPMYTDDFVDGTVSYVSTGAGVGIYNNLYYPSSGSASWTANTYGITFSVTTPALASQSQETFGLKVRTPAIRINYNNSYINQDAINALDTTKTKIYMKQELYQSAQNNLWHGLNMETIRLYQRAHDIT